MRAELGASLGLRTELVSSEGSSAVQLVLGAPSVRATASCPFTA